MKKKYTFILTLLLAVLASVSLYAEPDPCENFGAAFTYEAVDLNVQFKNKSTGDYKGIHWDFGDGLTSKDENPLHVYKNAGKYKICLTIESEFCYSVTCKTVEIGDGLPPTCLASFTYTLKDGFLIADGSASTPLDQITKWSWFLDDKLVSEKGPKFEKDGLSKGEHKLCLVIETKDDCKSYYCKYFVVDGEKDCSAMFTYFVDGLTVKLNGEKSTPLDKITKWEWWVGGVLKSDDGPDTFITFDEPGEKKICLVITTDEECTAEYCQVVKVGEGGDKCNALFTYTLKDGFLIADGSTSTPLDQITNWWWYLDGKLISEKGPIIEEDGLTSGEHKLCLLIKTKDGCKSDYCQTFVVEGGSECEAMFTYTVDGLTLKLNGEKSTPLDKITEWKWWVNGVVTKDGGPLNSITFIEPGTYEVCLSIATSTECEDEYCKTVVIETPPTCDAAFTATVDGNMVYVDGSASTGDGGIVGWTWKIKGKVMSTDGPTANFEVGEPGEYKLCLIIEAADGCKSDVCQTIIIGGGLKCEAFYTYEINDFSLMVDGSDSYSSADITGWKWYINEDLVSEKGPTETLVVPEPGVYFVCLKIFTSDGCVDAFCKEIEVTKPCPEVKFNVVPDEDNPLIIHFENETEGGVTFHWDFGDDTEPSTDLNPTHEFDEPDTYVICLTVVNEFGCEEEVCIELSVGGNPPAKKDGLQIKPNFGNAGNISFWVNSNSAQKAQVNITSQVGQFSSNFSRQLTKGQNQFVVDLSKLAPGVYIVTTTFDSGVVSYDKLVISE